MPTYPGPWITPAPVTTTTRRVDTGLYDTERMWSAPAGDNTFAAAVGSVDSSDSVAPMFPRSLMTCIGSLNGPPGDSSSAWFLWQDYLLVDFDVVNASLSFDPVAPPSLPPGALSVEYEDTVGRALTYELTPRVTRQAWVDSPVSDTTPPADVFDWNIELRRIPMTAVPVHTGEVQLADHWFLPAELRAMPLLGSFASIDRSVDEEAITITGGTTRQDVWSTDFSWAGIGVPVPSGPFPLDPAVLHDDRWLALTACFDWYRRGDELGPLPSAYYGWTNQCIIPTWNVAATYQPPRYRFIFEAVPDVIGAAAARPGARHRAALSRPPIRTTVTLLGDRFAAPILLTGTSGSRVFTNVGATLEPPETDGTTTVGHYTVADAGSIWFAWTPPAGNVWVSTQTTPLPTWDSYLVVYTGSALASLVFVADGDDNAKQSGSTLTYGTSKATWTADGTTTYYIQLMAFDDGDPYGPMQRDDLVLTWGTA